MLGMMRAVNCGIRCILSIMWSSVGCVVYVRAEENWWKVAFVPVHHGVDEMVNAIKIRYITLLTLHIVCMYISISGRM